MNALLDINLDAATSFADSAANSGTAPLGNEASVGDETMNAWPWWSHGVARKMATLIQEQRYSMLAALKLRTLEGGRREKWSICAMELMSTDQRSHFPRPSHFLDASQKLMTSLNRHGHPDTNPEPGLNDATIWVARLCHHDADMTNLEVRLNGSVVGRQLSGKIQQVLWMAHRFNAHRNFREAQECFDTERKRAISRQHDYELQLGMYRLIESLQRSGDNTRPSPWQVRDLAGFYVGGKLGPLKPEAFPMPEEEAVALQTIPPANDDDFQESVQWLSETGWTELSDDDQLKPL
jgi:hypothetical protein